MPTPPAPGWRQLSITFTDPSTAEHHLLTRLCPALAIAEEAGLIAAWWFIRKQPVRLRYLLTDPATPGPADDAVRAAAQQLRKEDAAEFTVTIYEPEIHAFGGEDGMKAAHRLFHADSRALLDHHTTAAPKERPHHTPGRTELSVLLCTALMRTAGLDRYEQGDVWARVAAHRARTPTPSPNPGGTAALQTLLTVDTASGTAPREAGSLVAFDAWFAAFEDTGRTLRQLTEEGVLTRGLRAVITHHVLFHWNRAGLSSSTQYALASTAARVSFSDPRD